MSQNITFFLAALLFSFGAWAGPEKALFESGEKQLHLVELYSSEGCSSCPPADRWLAKLRTHKKLWKSFVPVEFHVDYWNQLGWIDPFSNKSFSKRQRSYAGEWNNRTVYTPGFALDGNEWRDRNLKSLEKTGPTVGNLKIYSLGADKYKVEFQSHKKLRDNLKVYATHLGNGLSTDVKSGENKGETLRHEFVVLAMSTAKLKRSGQTYTGEIKLKKNTKAKPSSQSLAFWVSTTKSLRPIQATGGDITAKKKMRVATFAGGCFWCMEPPYEKLKGIGEVVSGFSGGKSKNPSYKDVARGKTKHLEVVQVHYDPKLITYNDLLEVFWRQVNPTDAGGQFVDRGPHYATAIFYHDEEQKALAEKSKLKLQKSKRYGDKKIITPIRKFESFYAAEDYHQDYYKKNPLRYKYYRYNSGRDQYLKKIWKGEGVYMPNTQTFEKPSKGELKKQLSEIQYKVTQEDGTEPPFKNKYWNNKKPGIYVDIVSGEPLFSSTHKFESGTGWPSFYQPLEKVNIYVKKDYKLLFPRMEVRSRKGDSHLGHVFNDGPEPTGMRFCINSAALRFVGAEDLEKEGYGQYAALFNK